MTPHVRAKIRNGNRLRQTIHQNRQEWIDASREANEAISEAKSESWKNLLQDAMSNFDGPNMWKVIQGLNGTPHANSPNEAILHNGRTITDIKSKANVLTSKQSKNVTKTKVDVNVLKQILFEPEIFKWGVSVCECMSGGNCDVSFLELLP